MKADFYSLFCYMGAMCLTMYFARKHEKGKNDKLFLAFSYLTIVCFCGFRFFVGNDYYGYFSVFENIRTGYIPADIEPSYIGLNFLFIGSRIGYFLVLFSSTIITYLLLFKVLKDLNILKWGIFCVYTLCFLIIANDQVRQGIAISIFFFAIRYIEREEFWKYLGLVLIATSFHYSAFITIIAYLLKNINFKPNVAFIFLCIAFILKISGVAEVMLHTLASYASFYNDYYGVKALNERYFSGATFGIQLLYFFIASGVAILFGHLNSKKAYYNVFVVGACLYMLSWGQMLFERASLYYFQVIILVLPYVLNKKIIISMIMFWTCIVYFSLQSLFAMEKNGAVPYRTIYQENLENPPYDKTIQGN